MLYLYYLLERLDGEKGLKLIPYKTAQRWKLELLYQMDRRETIKES